MKRRKAPAPKLVKGPFEPDQFTATQFSAAQDKASFANHLVKFIEQRFPAHLWVLWFYRRLSNCFGHIAHYDEHGFWEEWFHDHESRVRWLEYIGTGGAYGNMPWGADAAHHSFADVERAIMNWLRETPFHLARAIATRDVEREGIERAQLARLQAKYPTPEPMPMKRPPAMRRLIRDTRSAAARPLKPAPAAAGTLTAEMLGGAGEVKELSLGEECARQLRLLRESHAA